MKQITASKRKNPGRNPVALQNNLAVGAGGVFVAGNVEGNIQVVNKNIEVNAEHGAVVNFYDAPSRVKKRDAVPKPGRSVRGFVNRTDELKRLDKLIQGKEVVTILGADGMGKSALLRQAANQSAAQFQPDGVLFMEGVDELGQALGFEDVIQRLFDKTFESEPRLKVNFDIAQTYLGNLRALVVFNGLTLSIHSLSRMADLFPMGAILIESKYAIDNNISEAIRLGPLPRQEAVRLLTTKAGLESDDRLQRLLDSICSRLADVPLAVVIAAHAIQENNLPLATANEMLATFKPVSTDAYRAGIERAYALAESTLTELELQWLAAAALAPGISIDPNFLHSIAADESAAKKAQEHLQAMGLLTANSPRLRIDPAIRSLARNGADELYLVLHPRAPGARRPAACRRSRPPHAGAPAPVWFHRP